MLKTRISFHVLLLLSVLSVASCRFSDTLAGTYSLVEGQLLDIVYDTLLIVESGNNTFTLIFTVGEKQEVFHNAYEKNQSLIWQSENHFYALQAQGAVAEIRVYNVVKKLLSTALFEKIDDTCSMPL